VSYAQAGTDVNNLNIGVGQMVGVGLMSKETAMSIHPWVNDPELEHDRIVSESLEAAALAAFQQGAASGQIPVTDVIRVQQLVSEQDMPFAKAVEKAQEEAQERQATPAAATDPAAQPGMAVPGAGGGGFGRRAARVAVELGVPPERLAGDRVGCVQCRVAGVGVRGRGPSARPTGTGPI
jgi:hypothetical protein